MRLYENLVRLNTIPLAYDYRAQIMRSLTRFSDIETTGRDTT